MHTPPLLPAHTTSLHDLPPSLQALAHVWDAHSAPAPYLSQTSYKLTTDIHHNPLQLELRQTLSQSPFELSAQLFCFPSATPRVLFDSKRHQGSSIPLFLQNNPFSCAHPSALTLRTFLASPLWHQTIQDTYLTHLQLEKLCHIAIRHIRNIALHVKTPTPAYTATQLGPAHWHLLNPIHPDCPPLTTILTGYSNTTFNDRPCPFLLHLAHTLPPHLTLNQAIPFYSPVAFSLSQESQGTHNVTPPSAITSYSSSRPDSWQHTLQTQPAFYTLVFQIEQLIYHMLSC